MKNHIHIGTLMLVAGILLVVNNGFAIRFIWELNETELLFRLSILGLLTLGVMLLWHTPEE